MKIISMLLLFSTSSVMAFPLLPIKERLRIHMWTYGLKDSPTKKIKQSDMPPEEIERALKKL